MIDEQSHVWEHPRKVLERYGLKPKRAFSQNFLTSTAIIRRIVSSLNLGENNSVIEIGAGTGVLTRELLDRKLNVIALEQDRDMLRILESELMPNAAFRIVAGDAVDFSYTQTRAELGARVLVVGNLPCASSGAILRSLVEKADALSQVVLMLQREVAARLSARPQTKAYGALTVFCKSVFDVEYLFEVRPKLFYPPPQVSSAVVRLTPHRRYPDLQSTSFAKVVKAAFQTRRKQLKNALSQAFDAHHVERALADIRINPERRAETLGVEEFIQLSQHLQA